MNLLETLALLTFILGLLGLIVDVVRLTIEVMMITKKIARHSVPSLTVNLFD